MGKNSGHVLQDMAAVADDSLRRAYAFTGAFSRSERHKKRPMPQKVHSQLTTATKMNARGTAMSEATPRALLHMMVQAVNMPMGKTMLQ